METNLWHDIKKDKNSPDTVKVVVETPKDSSNRYEYDTKYNMIKLDKVIYSPVNCPGDYGFIPRTYGEDSTPLDVIVLSSEPSYPGVLMRARPVALLRITYGSMYDDKVVAVPMNDPQYKKVRDRKDLKNHQRDELEHFFNVYKHLEGKSVKIQWRSAATAMKVIERGIRLYDRKFS